MDRDVGKVWHNACSVLRHEAKVIAVYSIFLVIVEGSPALGRYEDGVARVFLGHKAMDALSTAQRHLVL